MTFNQTYKAYEKLKRQAQKINKKGKFLIIVSMRIKKKA